MAVASSNKSGTISGTGATAEITGSKIDVKISYGSGTILDIEEKMLDGTWIKVEVGLQTGSDAHHVFEGATDQTLRLNCTTYSASTKWEMNALL